MPRKNTERIYLPDSYYHIFNRGINREDIFIGDQDYAVFLNLFKRYLSSGPATDKQGRQYPWLYKEVNLLAFCLIPNHFHALVYQSSPSAITRLFGALTTSYGMYFNNKYGRVGPAFQSKFKTKLIDSDGYLQHISRYIHLNPGDYYLNYEFSSLPYYLKNKRAEWIKPKAILDLFNSSSDYGDFVADYQSYKKSLDELKHYLAD